MESVKYFMPWSTPNTKPEVSLSDKAIKVATYTGMVVVRGLAAAAVLYATGAALSQLGGALAGAATEGTFIASTLELASKKLIDTAAAVTWLSAGIFKCIAVPIYAVGYVLPRWIITEGLPQLATGLRQLAITITDTAWQSLEWLAREVIVPVGNFIATVIKEIPSYIQSVTEAVFNNVLQPVYTHIIQPAYQFAADTLQTLESALANAASSLLQSVADVADNVWKMVSVSFEQIAQPALKSLQNMLWSGLETTQTALVSLHEWIIQTLQDLGNSIAEAYNSLPKFA